MSTRWQALFEAMEEQNGQKFSAPCSLHFLMETKQNKEVQYTACYYIVTHINKKKKVEKGNRKCVCVCVCVKFRKNNKGRSP